MLNHISIKNFAIIENTEIDFEEGLNIITGETGAGKSIVIEAISLALGSRADSSFVRNGSDKAIVQLLATLNNQEIVITREVSSTGKNLCKLNGQIVTLTELNETCKKLADIHGQYDNQYLLNPENHIILVDNYQLDKITPIKQSFSSVFHSFIETKAKLKKLISMEQDNLKKKDFYQFEISEIDNAALLENEDVHLEEKISVLHNSEKIYDALESAYSCLSNEDFSVLSALNSSLHGIREISSYSNDLLALSDEFSDAYYKLEDVATNVRNLRDSITFSPEELDTSISRLNLIESLKKKYGSTIPEILEYRDRIEEELSLLKNYDESKLSLEKELTVLKERLIDISKSLTKVRKESAKDLEQKIQKELHDLNFQDANLEISFSTPPEIQPNGNDIVEIMISTNKGEPLKPLVKTASGGEISRIMLAFKNITCAYDNIPTMIFDEIDSGISGITASIVGRKLKDISNNYQIICITHLPQIAATGDYNYRIHKETDDKKTYTIVKKLTENEKVDEIARLLGGTNITETTKKSARELICQNN